MEDADQDQRSLKFNGELGRNVENLSQKFQKFMSGNGN